MTACDELVTLLAEHRIIAVHAGRSTDSRPPPLWTRCSCGWHGTADHRDHLADVLLAAGWTKGQP